VRQGAFIRAVQSLRRAMSQSLLQFRSNPLRTFLTLLGIVFGVASVVSMLAIGEGAQQEILATIETMGADVVHVKAKPVDKDRVAVVVNKSRGLGLADVGDIRQVLPDIKTLAYRARIMLEATDISAVDPTTLQVFAVSPGYRQLHKLKIGQGRGLLSLDHAGAARVAVIGDRLARRSFGNRAVGKRIRLDYAYFEIVGVFDTRAGKDVKDLPIDPHVHRDAIVIPLTACNEAIRQPPAYSELSLLSIKVSDTRATLSAKHVLEPLFREMHGGQQDVDIVAPEELLRQKEATQSVLNIVLLSIAAISLLVGGIGVMNIMLANIMERIFEIGLRRAVGARRADIRNQFLLEAVLICTIGGVAGVALGFAISVGVTMFADMPVAFPWYAAILSLAISALVGVTFGMMPALRASNVDPIEALQHG
jgi:putative ABC transport system permease protein